MLSCGLWRSRAILLFSDGILIFHESRRRFGARVWSGRTMHSMKRRSMPASQQFVLPVFVQSVVHVSQLQFVSATQGGRQLRVLN